MTRRCSIVPNRPGRWRYGCAGDGGPRPIRDEDPTIPLDIDHPDYVAVFGRLDDDDTTPHNVTPLLPRPGAGRDPPADPSSR